MFYAQYRFVIGLKMEEKPIPVKNIHEGVTCMSTCHAKTSEDENEGTIMKLYLYNLLHFCILNWRPYRFYKRQLV